MNDNKTQQNTLTENELFHLGGKTSKFVIAPAQIRYHHIKVEDLEKPVAAIAYKDSNYSLFRTISEWAEVEKITSRLSIEYIITVTKKGWAIWVLE